MHVIRNNDSRETRHPNAIPERLERPTEKDRVERRRRASEGRRIPLWPFVLLALLALGWHFDRPRGTRRFVDSLVAIVREYAEEICREAERAVRDDAQHPSGDRPSDTTDVPRKTRKSKPWETPDWRLPPDEDGPVVESPRTQGKSTFDFTDGAHVSGTGCVEAVLPDDTDPPRHQRFIISDCRGKTLLVAHNIDLSARLANLAVGDTVIFCGEYKSNDRGGVIHRTHPDPKGIYPNGWVKRIPGSRLR